MTPMKKSFLITIVICLLSFLFYSCEKDNGMEWRGIDLPEISDVLLAMEDTAFMEYCLDYFDTDGNWRLSMAEAAAVEVINIPSYKYSIKSLKGIEYFTSLTSLDCSYKSIKSLDLSNNRFLTTLQCHHNEIEGLTVSNNPLLTSINCMKNNLSCLDVSKNKELKQLYCLSNHITHLDVSNVRKRLSPSIIQTASQ